MSTVIFKKHIILTTPSMNPNHLMTLWGIDIDLESQEPGKCFPKNL